MTYPELNENLQGRCFLRRKLGNNTYACRYIGRSDEPDRTAYITILYHDTHIMAFYPNGDIMMNIGRFFTVTTKQRLNEFLPAPYRVYSDKGEWFLWNRNFKIAPFTNGMVLDAFGNVSRAISMDEWREERKQRTHIARSEGAKKAAATRKFAKETWKLLGGDAYYA
jgi:hypothetical protein